MIEPRFLLQASSAAAFALAIAVAAAPASAALYKWTDAGGRVVYSDQPPTGNVKYELLGAAPPPANPNAVKELAAKEAEFKKRQADQAQAVAKAESANADAARLRDYCAQLRSQIITLGQGDLLMYRSNEKGERLVMEEPDRRAEAARLERTMRERNCPRM